MKNILQNLKEQFIDLIVAASLFCLGILATITVGVISSEMLPRMLHLVIFWIITLTLLLMSKHPPKTKVIGHKGFLAAALIISVFFSLGLDKTDAELKREKMRAKIASGTYDPDAPVVIPKATKPKDDEATKLAWIEHTQNAVRQKLKDPSSAQFKNAHFIRKDKGPMVCGEVNSKNSFGAFTGYQHFIASGEQILLLEEQTKDFAKVWNEICR